MNEHQLGAVAVKGVGMIALLFLSSFGAVSPALAENLESGLSEPGLSDGEGVGIDLSVQGTFNEPRSPQSPPAAQPPEQPDSPETPANTPEQPPSRPEVQLFGDSDRSFGVEILDRMGQQQWLVRIGIPFL